MIDFFLLLVIGLSLGSFATALVWRVPRGISWIFSGGNDTAAARSCCTTCHATLRLFDLVPLFSWLVQRGRCRHCGAPIPWRYPLVELLVLAGVIGIYAVYGFSYAGMAAMAAVPFLVALLAIDIEHMILPDQLTLICGIMGLIFIFVSAPPGGLMPVFAWHVLAALIYSGIIWLAGLITKMALKKEALGLGDVKFMIVAGLWLGMSSVSSFFILSGIMGILWGAGWRMFKKSPVFPFGPALILTFYVCLLAQKPGFFAIFPVY